MKEFTSVQYFDYPWDYLSAANWNKYPNEVSTHVVGVDVLRREINPINGNLITERLITCKQPIPNWLQYLAGIEDKSYVREVSIINLKEKSLVMRSVNLTMVNLLKVNETVIYRPDVNDPLNKTQFKQIAKIKSNYGWGNAIKSKIEDWAVERFSQNASKGKLGFESVLKLYNWDEQPKISVVFDNLVDSFKVEINDLSNQILNELKSESMTILDELKTTTLNIKDEINSCNVFNEINMSTFQLLNQMNFQTNEILTNLNFKINNVIKEINEKTVNLIEDLEASDDKNNDNFSSLKVLSEIQIKTQNLIIELNDTKNTILKEMNQNNNSIFEELDKRAIELFGNHVNNIADSSSNNELETAPNKSFFNSLIFKLIHLFRN